ncbi:uncharacterized protein PV06_06061 [Exophiala oligosperma]|uniref:Uncharacterized protein n=2 Tax=Chaetothyriales TaxID=34395 RepID=A0A0D2BYL3_9EURO|nr:uncharacterized protein PV06_06061 [Exophiala oligosperma]KAJ9620713.1 hypothetical protein H2204_012199 [Knufia peltigerae]KIW42517.1 hypothetical protein PV06_06061 [Exophiala oligosperma]
MPLGTRLGVTLSMVNNVARDSSNDDDDQYWLYDPSRKLADVAAVVFAVLGIAHLILLIIRRYWFCLPYALGALLEVAGYVFRDLSARHQDKLWLYAAQQIFILIAPALFAAAVYMTLGRLIRATGCTHLSPVRVTWLTKIFVIGDVLCFFVQAIGASILSNAKSDDKDKQNLGKDVALGGLILQVVIFFFFMFIAVKWHFRMHRRVSSKHAKALSSTRWELGLWILYVVSVIISVRNIVRVIEFAEGAKGYFFTHEWTLFTFDALLMALVLVLCYSWYFILGSYRDGDMILSQEDDYGPSETTMPLQPPRPYHGFDYSRPNNGYA